MKALDLTGQRNNNIPLLILNYNIDDIIPYKDWEEKLKSFGGEHYRN